MLISFNLHPLYECFWKKITYEKDFPTFFPLFVLIQ